jgi:hypothetical protein
MVIAQHAKGKERETLKIGLICQRFFFPIDNPDCSWLNDKGDSAELIIFVSVGFLCWKY